jgi:predicted dehydrogenase
MRAQCRKRIAKKEFKLAMKTLKVGIIGTGGIAQSHVDAIQGIEGFEVVAVADLIQERAEKTAAKLGTVPSKNIFTDYHKLLEIKEIDTVSVCTWNNAHCAPSVDALAAGKHVLVEKPMTATLQDATTLTRAAKKSDKVMMVALKSLYTPAIVAAHGIVSSGALGDVYYCESIACRRNGLPGWPEGSFTRKETAGIGAVADIGVYSLAESLYLMNWPKPTAVYGISNNLLGKKYSKPVMGSWWWDPDVLSVEDFGVAAVRFENDMLMIFKTSWLMNMDSLGSSLMLGTKAGLRLHPLTVFKDEFGTMTDQKIDVAEMEPIDQFRSEYKGFYEAVVNHLPSPIPAENMLITNTIIQGLIDSTAAGHEVAVKVPEV